MVAQPGVDVDAIASTPPHTNREARLVRAFLFSKVPYLSRTIVLKSGYMGPMHPPLCSDNRTAALHSVPHLQSPAKTFLVRMGPIGPPKNFLQKIPLTPPVSSHNIPSRVEKERVMNRWARVTNSEDGCSLWVNEIHVTVLKQYESGCMIGFSTSEDDVVRVVEDVDDIFAAWDDWQSIHKDA